MRALGAAGVPETARLPDVPGKHALPTVLPPIVLDPRTDPVLPSQSIAINNAGVVVGSYTTAAAPDVPGLFTGRADAGPWSLGLADVTPVDVNDAGQISGCYHVESSELVGFVHRDGVTVPTPGFLPAYQNNRGQVVGMDRTHRGSPCGVTMWENGIRTDLLALLPRARLAHPLGINDAGQVIASVHDADGVHGGIYHSGAWRGLGSLGGPFTLPTGINEAGDVVGSSYLTDGHEVHAFLWREGRLVDLGGFGSPRSAATAVNDAGQILVEADATHNPRVYLWDGTCVTEVTVEGAAWTEAVGLNNQGLVTAKMWLGGRSGGFVWRGGESASLAGSYSYASPTDMNDSGQVVGWVAGPDDVMRAALWTVPPAESSRASGR